MSRFFTKNHKVRPIRGYFREQMRWRTSTRTPKGNPVNVSFYRGDPTRSHGSGSPYTIAPVRMEGDEGPARPVIHIDINDLPHRPGYPHEYAHAVFYQDLSREQQYEWLDFYGRKYLGYPSKEYPDVRTIELKMDTSGYFGGVDMPAEVFAVGYDMLKGRQDTAYAYSEPIVREFAADPEVQAKIAELVA